jgi:hypothetical protein
MSPASAKRVAISSARYRVEHDAIVFSDDATDEDMAVLDTLPHLKSIGFSRGVNKRPPIRVTSAGLAHLRSVPELEVLQLLAVPVTDAGLANIETLHNLRELRLDNSDGLTDAALAYVGSLTNLRAQYFFQAPLTDAGIARIKDLRQLESLTLGYAKISDRSLVAVISHFAKLQALDLQHTAIRHQVAQGSIPRRHDDHQSGRRSRSAEPARSAALEHLASLTAAKRSRVPGCSSGTDAVAADADGGSARTFNRTCADAQMRARLEIFRSRGISIVTGAVETSTESFMVEEARRHVRRSAADRTNGEAAAGRRGERMDR